MGIQMNLILTFLIFTFSFSLSAQTKVAVVKIIRGEVELIDLGKPKKLKIDDWVQNGNIVKTADKSFVKLIFTDKSQMNIGPNSEMKIESFGGSDSGVIDLVKGKIRSQVTKDYLQMKDKNKSKLFIKTSNAVMGVRGTDFMVSTNGINTSAILFEGEIVFNKLEGRGEISSQKLEDIVDRGVRIFPGEFSVMEGNKPMPTVPSLLNNQQLEKLEKNEDLGSNRSPSNVDKEVSKSVVPAGLSGEVVSNNPKVLKEEIAQISNNQIPVTSSRPNGNAEGFVAGNQVRPANGSFIHIDSGVIIPPGNDSVLDPNTNTYIPGQNSGKVGADGNYIPPKNMEITNNGRVLITTSDNSGKPMTREVPPPPPVVSQNRPPVGMIMGPGQQPPPPGSVGARPPQTGDIPLPTAGSFDTRFNPTGGIININDPTRETKPTTQTTIIVNPGKE
jgi:hypothetical protein